MEFGTEWVSVVLGSATVAAVVSAAVDAWREKRRERRNARLDALRAAVALEGYALHCARRVSDHLDFEASGGAAGRQMGAVPAPPDIPVSSGLILPKATLAHRLHILPQVVGLASERAEFWWNIAGDMDSAREAAKQSAAEVALESLSLASALRSNFGLPARQIAFGETDVGEFLRANVGKAAA